MPSEGPFGQITQIEVDALERAAAERLRVARPTPPPYPWADPFFTIGVTGTNGKTSTTYLIASILRAAGHPVVAETTIGYLLEDEAIDVPRTTRGFLGAMQYSASRGAKHAVVEATSQALARGYAKLWRFDLGVFTNLSQDHIAAHGSWEHYLASKAQLFVHLAPGRTAVLNAFDSASELIDRVIPADVHRLWYGVPSRGTPHHTPDLVAERVDVSADGTTLHLGHTSLKEQLGPDLRIPLIGDVFAENALAAACAAMASGCCADHVRQGLSNCPVVPGRFEVVHRDPLVVIDFAHTPDALARTLDTARSLAGKSRLIVVFGAGGERDQDKRQPMGRAVGQRADIATVTNDNPRREDPRTIAKQVAAGCRRGGRAYVEVQLDRREAIAHAIEKARRGDVIVIAGKGHEKGQILGDQTLPFSDVETVRAVLGVD